MGGCAVEPDSFYAWFEAVFPEFVGFVAGYDLIHVGVSHGEDDIAVEGGVGWGLCWVGGHGVSRLVD